MTDNEERAAIVEWLGRAAAAARVFTLRDCVATHGILKGTLCYLARSLLGASIGAARLCILEGDHLKTGDKS